MRLETSALHWLLYKHNCHYAVCERPPRGCVGEPDVIGVRRDRKLVEIEVKRSVSDFRANSQKQHVKRRDIYLNLWPVQFYFCVPPALVPKVTPILPQWSGLLCGGCDGRDPYLNVIKNAPTNAASTPLSLREAVAMARCMANHVAAAEKRYDDVVKEWRKGRTEVGDFQI
jgi:hypothetical protein